MHIYVYKLYNFINPLLSPQAIKEPPTTQRQFTFSFDKEISFGI